MFYLAIITLVIPHTVIRGRAMARSPKSAVSLAYADAWAGLLAHDSAHNTCSSIAEEWLVLWRDSIVVSSASYHQPHVYVRPDADTTPDSSIGSDDLDDAPPELLPGEDMDGDHASALASAGFGTDEDYGGGDEHI
jgi:hypothetical protein